MGPASLRAPSGTLLGVRTSPVPLPRVQPLSASPFSVPAPFGAAVQCAPRSRALSAQPPSDASLRGTNTPPAVKRRKTRKHWRYTGSRDMQEIQASALNRPP